MNEIKKPIWKKWWFWVVVIIVLAAIGNAGGDDQPAAVQSPSSESQPAAQQEATAETQEAQPESKPAEQEPAPEAKEPDNPPTMSKAEFDAIQNGMTYEEVVQIVGGEGELLSETGTPGDPSHTVMYMWEGEGDIGANANAMFQGGKMISKSQIGLK
ncbi:MAG: hypothetical protein H0Z34_13505 [Brevibacillus sp.]|nr:hypothetical protein [Brevibacillus sp.]